MPESRSSWSLALLALFTTPERAASIEGDLLEEARLRGRGWFWSQVLAYAARQRIGTPLRGCTLGLLLRKSPRDRGYHPRL